MTYTCNIIDYANRCRLATRYTKSYRMPRNYNKTLVNPVISILKSVVNRQKNIRQDHQKWISIMTAYNIYYVFTIYLENRIFCVA